jgi:haloalkane dehalogenase
MIDREIALHRKAYKESGAELIMGSGNNFFIEKVLPGAILRKLSDPEMTEYRRPFAKPGAI